MSRDRSQMHKCIKLTDSNAWVPQMTPLHFWSTNKTRVHQRKPSATFQSLVTWQGIFLCRIPQELAKPAWITTATYHTREIRQTRPPEMNSDWSSGIKIEIMFVVLLMIPEEFASNSQHRHANIAPPSPMSRLNVPAHRRGFVTACQACEIIFQCRMLHF